MTDTEEGKYRTWVCPRCGAKSPINDFGDLRHPVARDHPFHHTKDGATHLICTRSYRGVLRFEAAVALNPGIIDELLVQAPTKRGWGHPYTMIEKGV